MNEAEVRLRIINVPRTEVAGVANDRRSTTRLDTQIGLPDGRPTTRAEFETAHLSALEGLDAGQRVAIQDLIRSFEDAHPGRPDIMAARLENLGKVLDNGILTKPDESGESVLSQIAARLDAPLGDWTAGARDQVVSGLIRSLAKPDRIFQGIGTDTCTTAVLESYMAENQPAAFARFGLGLAFDGVGQAPGGARVEAKVSHMVRDDLLGHSGRKAFDSLIQGSLEAYAQQAFPDAGQRVKGGRMGRGGTYAGKGDSRGGLTFRQVVQLNKAILGRGALDFAAEVTETNRESVMARLVSTFARPSPLGRLSGVNQGTEEVPVGVVNEEGGLHEILVQGIRGETVVYSDPADGLVKGISLADFRNRLMSVVMPR